MVRAIITVVVSALFPGAEGDLRLRARGGVDDAGVDRAWDYYKHRA